MKKTMKTTMKAILMMVAFGILFFFGTTSKAATVPEVPEVQGLKQTGATVDSITMEWTPVADAEGYTTIYEVYRYNKNNDFTLLGTTAANITTWTVSGEQCISGGYYFVIATYISNTTTGLEKSSSTYVRVKMYTAPGQVQGFSFKSYGSSKNSACYKWQKMKDISGYELQLQDSNGNVLASKKIGHTYTMGSVQPFKKGIITKACIRAYRTVEGTDFYGEWSDYVYAATSQKVTSKRSKDGQKITVKWKKVTGAVGYRVLISTTPGKNYKKVKELNAKQTKYVITKCNKKKLSRNQTYYIRVQYLFMVDGKQVVSPIETGFNSQRLYGK